MGHSAKVAEKSYLQVTLDHWKAGASESAADQIGGPTGGPISANQGLSGGTTYGTTKPLKHEKSPVRRDLTGLQLPAPDTVTIPQSTKKVYVVWDFYTVQVNRKQKMEAGKRPLELRSRKKRSRLLTRVDSGRFKNVVHVARQYQAFLDRDDVVGYKQVAGHFGVTKASISQYLGILNRLPEDFVGWLAHCEDQAVVALFGKKKLNVIAKQPSVQHKQLLLAEAQKIPALLDLLPVEYHDLLVLLSAEPQPRTREHRYGSVGVAAGNSRGHPVPSSETLALHDTK